MLLIYSPSAVISILLCVYARRFNLASNVLLVTFFDSIHYLKRVYVNILPFILWKKKQVY